MMTCVFSKVRGALFIVLSFVYPIACAEELSSNLPDYPAISSYAHFVNTYKDKIYFNEREKLKQTIYTSLSTPLYDLQKYVLDEFQYAAECTHEQYKNQQQLFTQLFRSLAFSFIYEELRVLQQVAALFKLSSCDINWKKQLSECSPKTKYLKAWPSHLWSLIKIHPTWPLSSHMSRSKQQALWLEGKEDHQFYLAHHRLSKGRSGVVLRSQLDGLLGQACREDLDLIKKICNEEDHILGMAQIPLALQTLAATDFFRLIKIEENPLGCLRRYSWNHREEEKIPSFFIDNFIYIHHYLKNSPDIVYEQGRTFESISLLNYKDKGLGSTLKLEKLPEHKKEMFQIQKIANIKNKTKANKRVLQQYRKKVAKEHRKDKYQSAFLKAALSLMQDKEKIADVDMARFRFDFPFSIHRLQKLEKILPRFISLTALEEMKKHDHLGQKSAPLPLSLVKFMIEQNKHREIYNLKQVLGSRFYVFNDLDFKKRDHVNLVKLDFDDIGQQSWQISLYAD